MNRRNQRRVDIVVIIGLIIVLVGCIAMLSGCASTSDGTRQSEGSKAVHTTQEHKTFVVLPATEAAPAQIVPVTETTETWTDEKSRLDERSHAEGSSGPDMKQIAPVIGAVSSAVVTGATPGGWGKIIDIGEALITGTMLAWGAAKHREAKSHQLDAAEGWKLAQENALKVQPNQGIDHA